MADVEMPFVAIIGGLWKFDENTVAEAKDVSKIIGAELAKAGFGLVVYFSNDESLEPHVVSGYLSAISNRRGEIHVRYSEAQRGKVKFAEEKDWRDIFKYHLFPGDDWEMPFYRSLAEEEGVDAVLLLGGATSTLIAGQVAVARQLPILAVDQFGGSAAKIWNQLAQRDPGNLHSWNTHSAATFVRKLRKECEDAAAIRRDRRRREKTIANITSQRQQTSYAVGAFFALLVILCFGMANTSWVSAYPLVMFGGLISAGATGATVRGVLWPGGDNDPRSSLLLGSVAGFVVGLAYLIPQWVGAPDVLAVKTDAVSATNKIQFASAILVALSAGVGFDTVFTRLQKQAQDIPVALSK